MVNIILGLSPLAASRNPLLNHDTNVYRNCQTSPRDKCSLLRTTGLGQASSVELEKGRRE